MMEVQQLGCGKLLILLKGDDLRALPVPPSDMTTQDASTLLRRALGNTYDPSWDSVYFEMFPGHDSLLLFALQHNGAPSFFTFDSIEPVIDVAHACPSGLITYLTHDGEAYTLIVYPWHGENPPSVIGEYGRQVDYHAYFALHLSEHGTVIAGPHALDVLRHYFSKK
ncbi:MAG: adaptor protein MecA [Clostridiales bacterium]|nr:adaptor protein MecA [Clostridiales bacterium]